MTLEQIEKILKDATGDPSSGAVWEAIPVMAAAVAAALAPATEDRVLKAQEKR